MSRLLLILALCGLTTPALSQELVGHPTAQPPSDPLFRAEDLFKGDLGMEISLGCTNPFGTSGGPQDIAQGVTATVTPPFWINNHFYQVGTASSPTITALSFVCWRGGDTPGDEFARQAGLNFADGSHTTTIDPPVRVDSAMFFFGHNQPQSDAGFQWGLDTSSGSEGLSYIKAPTCGADVFTLVDALGFPGNWCMSVSVDQPTPIEVRTWGSLKSAF